MAPKSPKVLAVGSPKGGVGKTQTAVALAHLASSEGYRVMLADADENLSAYDWATLSDGMDFEVDDLRDAGTSVLPRLRELRGYDLVVVDLPGARTSDAWTALLQGTAGRPAVDGLLVPSAVRAMDLRVVLRVIREVVIPSGVPYLLVGTLVKTQAVRSAMEEMNALHLDGITTSRTLIRDLTVHAEAPLLHRALTEMPGGRHSTARAAEREYRQLAAEVFQGLLGMKWSHTRDEREGA